MGHKIICKSCGGFCKGRFCKQCSTTAEKLQKDPPIDQNWEKKIKYKCTAGKDFFLKNFKYFKNIFSWLLQ
jgi:hypothetical protein